MPCLSYHPNPEAVNPESSQLTTVYRVTQSIQIKISTSTPDRQTRQPRPHDRSQWPSLDRRQKAWHFDDNRHASTGMRGDTGCRDWTDRSRPLREVDEAQGPRAMWCGAGRGASQGCPAGQGPLGVSHLPQSETRGSQVLEALAMPRAVRLRRRPSQPVNWPRRRGAGGVAGRPASRCRHHAAQKKRMTGLRRGLEGGTREGGWEVGREVVCSTSERTDERTERYELAELRPRIRQELAALTGALGGRRDQDRRRGMNDRMARWMGRRL